MKSRVMAALAVLRIAAIAAAIVAAVGLRAPLPTRARSIAVLIDVSGSVGEEGREEARRAALALLSRLAKRDRAAVLAFAGRTEVLSRLVPARAAARALASAELGSIPGGDTDIALAVATAASLVDGEGGARAVYLFSDGRDSRGDGILPERFAASGTRLYAYPVGEERGGVRTEGLALPDVLRPRERAEASWSLSSDRKRSVAWNLSIDGSAAASGSVDLVPGLNRISLPLPPALSGAHEVSVEARDEEGSLLPAAGTGGGLSVSGPARVLVAGGGDRPSPIAAALRAQGMEAAAVGVDGIPEDPSGYSGVQAVVLDNVNALYVSELQQDRLLSYVAGGGGLLVVGGDQSLGRGEYFATPLEDMLPVSTDTRRRLFFTRARVLFVIDTSGSMSERVNGVTKQAAAMRGIADSVRALDPRDEVGILGFDDSPSWVMPFTSADEKEAILDSMTRMKEGGGTDLAEAMEEVVRSFGGFGPTRKHAVILTDGLTLDADFEGLSRSLSAVGATVSTVAVGDSVNEELLRSIAERSGGAYYRARQDQIPRVLAEETTRVSRDLINEGSFAPAELDASPASAGIAGNSPPVRGYLVTRAKPLARVHLVVDSEEGKRKPGERAPREELDPLLASWRYGAGKVAVFTSDSGAAWLAPWSGRPAYARLWAQVARSVERGNPDSGMVARAYDEGGALRILVEAVDAEGRAATGLDLRARGVDALSAPFSLRETAPGRYEALAPSVSRSADAGIERYAVSDARTGAWTEAWIWRQKDAELARTGPDEAALQAAAGRAGGALLRPEGLTPEEPRLSMRMAPLRWWALLASLVLFVVELYGRSTLFGQFKMARATAVAWWSRQERLVERMRRGRSEAVETKDDSARVMDAYRRLAERSLARALKDEGAEREEDKR